MGLEVVDTSSPGIRKLGDASLQASLQRVLAELPATKTAATVDIGADSQGIQAVAVVKLMNGWSVFGVLDRRFHGSWGGEAHVRWSGR